MREAIRQPIIGNQSQSVAISPNHLSSGESIRESPMLLIAAYSCSRSGLASYATGATATSNCNEPDEGRNQTSSDVIRRHQTSSDVIRRHQTSSDVIRRHQTSNCNEP